MGMDIKKIKRLASVLKKEDVEEFEWKDKDLYIRMKRVSTSKPTVQVQSEQIEQPAKVDFPETDRSAVETESGLAKGNQFIKSPIVGTFYRAPSPKADSYVQEGEQVSKGQVLCILEAMKLMNELEAEYPCEIVKTLVKNAEPVEFGEPLFEVKPL